MDQERSVYFSEWPMFIWKVVGFLHETHQTSPVDCDFQGMKFRLDLDLSFGRYYNKDTYELRINTNHHEIPEEFEEFQVSSCIVDEFKKEHFSSDTTVTRSVLVSREPIWTASRMELFLKYDELKDASGKNEILTFKLSFRPKSKGESSGIVEGELHEATGTGFCSKISTDFLQLFREDSITSDLVVMCRTIPFNVHSFIMSRRCKAFLDKLLHNSFNATSIEVDMCPVILERVLEFVYAGIVPDLNCDFACKLYRFGVEYKMEDLSGMCRNYLVDSLSNENAVRILTIAAENEDSQFKADVTEFIIKNPKILISGDWETVKPKIACDVYYEYVDRYHSLFFS